MAEAEQFDIELTNHSSLDSIDFDHLTFGSVFSDHMIEIDYVDGAWQTPKVRPYQKLSFAPSMVALHYGQTIFEGLKAYKDQKGNILTFRPEEHARRINESSVRLCMPQLPEETFLSCLKKLLEIDKDWIPEGKGKSLYIRPIMFATDEMLGVVPSNTYKFLIFTSPVAQYYAGDVKVMVEENYVRAAEGGTGYIKMGGNYSASLLPAKRALENGYQQILWTDSHEHKYVEEIGTMNVMFQIGDTIITPKLTTSILSGITRKSVIELAKRWGYNIEERRISVEELIEAHQKGLLLDAFGTGTAATITHITMIGYKGKDYIIPEDSPREFSTKAQDYLVDLKTGEAEDFMRWMTKI